MCKLLPKTSACFWTNQFPGLFVAFPYLLRVHRFTVNGVQGPCLYWFRHYGLPIDSKIANRVQSVCALQLRKIVFVGGAEKHEKPWGDLW